MKTTFTAAALAAGLATIAAAEGPPQGAGMPPNVMAQMNLGQAGLLWSFNNDDHFGTAQYRTGQDRATIGAARAPGAPADGYRDNATSLILPLAFTKNLAAQNAFLRFSLDSTLAMGDGNRVKTEGPIGRATLSYMYHPDANTMWSLGAFIEETNLDIVDSGTINRTGAGLRFDALSKLSAHWGITFRGEYSWGESDLRINYGPNIVNRHVQGDDRLYMQSELVGQYSSTEIGALPDGWKLMPVLGINFQRSTIEETADSFGAVSSGVLGDTEDYGALWAVARVEKSARPGEWAPNAMLGVEHILTYDLNTVVNEPTSLLVGFGASRMMTNGNRIDLSYSRHQGLDGERWSQGLVAAFTFSF